MKRLLQSITIASMLLGGCNTNSDNPDNKKQGITNETGITIKKEDNKLIVINRLKDTLTLKLPIADKIDSTGYTDSIYLSLTETEKGKKEISQKVTIGGIPFIVTVNKEISKIECPNRKEIEREYAKRKYPELLEFYVNKRKGGLSNSELNSIQKIYGEFFLKLKFQNLENHIRTDFLEGKIPTDSTDNIDYFRNIIGNAFGELCPYDPGIYYQTKNVMKKRK